MAGMKFNLEDFKKGHVARTLKGERFYYLAVALEREEDYQLIVACMDYEQGGWRRRTMAYRQDGRFSSKMWTEHDLTSLDEEAHPFKIKGYLNVYKNGTNLYWTKDEAEAASTPSRIKLIEL